VRKHGSRGDGCAGLWAQCYCGGTGIEEDGIVGGTLRRVCQ